MSTTKKRLLFVCATGIATSTQVMERVTRYLKDEGIEHEYLQTNVASVANSLDGVDLIVATTKIPYDVDVPVLRGLPFVTGIGVDDALAEIKSILTAE